MATTDDDHCSSNSSIAYLWLSKKKEETERPTERVRQEERKAKEPSLSFLSFFFLYYIRINDKTLHNQ
jgi:hypothetical protein